MQSSTVNYLVALGILFIQATFAQPAGKEAEKLFGNDAASEGLTDFSEIDQYILNLNVKKKVSESELVALITQKSGTTLEKARAIFMWIANNISYDTGYQITSKEEALKQRKGVCQAYSGLFQDFCAIAGIEAVTISGESKQYYYKKPSDLDRGGHAWNAVKLDDGRWMLVDATWGAGHVENKNFIRNLTGYWFDPSPQVYIFTHFPKEEKWQLLDEPVSRDDFLRLPPLSPNLTLWGFNPDALFSYYMKNKEASFPDYFMIDIDCKINMMPVCNELKQGKKYEFEVELPRNEEIAVIVNNKNWHKFEKEGNRHSLSFTPEEVGYAVVAVKKSDGKFGGVFKYLCR